MEIPPIDNVIRSEEPFDPSKSETLQSESLSHLVRTTAKLLSSEIKNPPDITLDFADPVSETIHERLSRYTLSSD